jgi:hypothetical protein
MSEFCRWVTPLNRQTIEPLYANQSLEYEDFTLRDRQRYAKL